MKRDATEMRHRFRGALIASFDRRQEVASSIRQQLKRETACLHRRLETDLGLLDGDLSLDRYRRILELFFGFYSPLEASMAHLVPAGVALEFPLQARAGLIGDDLRSIGLSRRQVAGLPRCVDLPRLSSREDLAGCLYVIEGACLGGQFIAPVLREQLGLGQTCGASFFIGDGERMTQERWGLFLSWLQELERAGAEAQAVITAARATFLAFARWVEQAGFATGQAITD